MSRSSRKRQKLKPVLFIYCEGETEVKYFTGINESIDEEDEKFAFDIRLIPTPKSDAFGLIKQAQDDIVALNPNPDDEFWVIFDKDGYTKHKEAFNEANKKGKKVNIAFSSIAFEHWVLLHFEKNSTAFVKSDCKDSKNGKYVYCGQQGNTNFENCKGKRCVAGYLRENAYYQDYEKARGSIYLTLAGKTDNALENSAWLRMKQEAIISQTNPIYQLNPYTDIDLLVSKILGSKKIIWYSLGSAVTINNIAYTVTSVNYQNNTYKISINAENIGKTRQIINNSLISDFYLKNHQLNSLTLTNSIILEIGETGTFELVSGNFPETTDLTLIYEDVQKKVIFVLPTN